MTVKYPIRAFIESIINTEQLKNITSIYIYYSKFRFWIANLIARYALDMGWKLNLICVDEFNDSDFDEMINGTTIMDIHSLLIILVDHRIKYADKLGFGFQLPGYKGISIILDPFFPNEYLYDFIDINYRTVIKKFHALAEKISNYTVEIKMNDGILHFSPISDLHTFPFSTEIYDNKYVFFPSTYAIISIKNLSGVFVCDVSISLLYEENDLIEPFGPIGSDEPLILEIKNNKIVSIKNSRYCDRLVNILAELPASYSIIDRIAFGMGHNKYTTGTRIDMLLGNTITLSVNNFSLFFTGILKDIK